LIAIPAHVTGRALARLVDTVSVVETLLFAALIELCKNNQKDVQFERPNITRIQSLIHYCSNLLTNFEPIMIAFKVVPRRWCVWWFQISTQSTKMEKKRRVMGFDDNICMQRQQVMKMIMRDNACDYGELGMFFKRLVN
jgi:hypothetical protein